MVDSSIVAPAPPARPRVGLAPARMRDEALARRVAHGDERAFAEIHRRYAEPLYRYCRSIVRHEHDAQDVLQTTLIAAYRALGAGRRDAPLRPWLYRIAHNESISLLRRRRPDAELTSAVPDLAGVEERADVRERMARLVADLRALPDRQRSALVMRELNGLSHEDIALALQTTPAAAKQTVFEARRALADLDAGRAMSCDDVCRVISDGDRRQLRGRRVRSHLRACSHCGDFAAAISTRRSDLSALAPGLPGVAAAGLLAQVLGGSSGRSASGAVSVKALGAGAVTKTLATGLIIAGGVAGYAHLAPRGHRPVARASRPVRPAAVSVRESSEATRLAAPGVAARGIAPVRRGRAVGVGGAHRAVGAAPTAAVRGHRRPAEPFTGRGAGASAAGPSGAGASAVARRGHQPGRGWGAGGGRGSAVSSSGGNSTTTAARHGWAGAGQPPGQAHRAARPTATSRGHRSTAQGGAATGAGSGGSATETTSATGKARGSGSLVGVPAAATGTSLAGAGTGAGSGHAPSGAGGGPAVGPATGYVPTGTASATAPISTHSK